MKKELACELLQELDPNKSMDPNTIHPRMLRELADIIARLLSITFEKSQRLGDCPGDWKANITPIYKKGLKEDPGDYRSISLIQSLRKLLNKYSLGLSEVK